MCFIFSAVCVLSVCVDSVEMFDHRCYLHLRSQQKRSTRHCIMHPSSLHIFLLSFSIRSIVHICTRLDFSNDQTQSIHILMSQGQMDEATRAMCYALRNPGPGKSPTKSRQLVWPRLSGHTSSLFSTIALSLTRPGCSGPRWACRCFKPHSQCSC